MRKFLVFVLAVIIVSQSLVNVGISVYYHLNKAYISQKLCINRDKPQLHCNGHCYLSKQLKQSEEGERKQTERMVKESEQVVYFVNHFAVQEQFPQIVSELFPRYTLSSKVLDISTALLKPPIA